MGIENFLQIAAKGLEMIHKRAVSVVVTYHHSQARSAPLPAYHFDDSVGQGIYFVAILLKGSQIETGMKMTAPIFSEIGAEAVDNLQRPMPACVPILYAFCISADYRCRYQQQHWT